MVKTKQTKNKPAASPYPKLMRSKASGAIYLITSPCVGTRIHGGLSVKKIGAHSYRWDFAELKDYAGTVSISSE